MNATEYIEQLEQSTLSPELKLACTIHLFCVLFAYKLGGPKAALKEHEQFMRVIRAIKTGPDKG